MYRTTVLRLGVALASCATMATAHAQLASEEILEQVRTFEPASYCQQGEVQTERNCVIDVQKSLRRLQQAFSQALRDEKDAWLSEHSDLGIGTAFRNALNLYNGAVSERRSRFREYTRDIQKQFYTLRRTVRESRVQEPKGITRSISTSDVEAVSKCDRIVESSSKRLCMRLELRLVNVEAIQQGLYGRIRNQQEEGEETAQ